MLRAEQAGNMSEMQRGFHGPQIYVALVLAAAAAMLTMPRDAGAHYQALGMFVLHELSHEANAEPMAFADPTDTLTSP